MKDRISKLMELEQIAPTRFALMIGTQPSVVSHILNGRNKPSLEVVQKILNAFPTINPDWLISGVGSMYREELPSRQASLFDIKPEISSSTVSYEPKREEKNYPPKEIKQVEVAQPIEIKEIVKEKTVKKITVYYSDMTFEEFLPNSSKE
ncbi:MAG: helix-turn-helix domain protein [Bacteroidetes bacterium]|nr:helix-turn-helix domain protein [Bacteroidota bacterium]